MRQLNSWFVSVAYLLIYLVQITAEYTQVERQNLFDTPSIYVVFGGERWEWKGKVKEKKHKKKKKIMQGHVALVALMSTRYRFTTVPHELSSISSFVPPSPVVVQAVPCTIGNSARETVRQQYKETAMTALSGERRLSKNEQYKIDINQSQYRDHLVKWVELLAEQNQVRTATQVKDIKFTIIPMSLTNGMILNILMEIL